MFSLSLLAERNLVPDALVVIEENQLHDEAHGRKYGATTEVAEHHVGQPKADKIAEGLPGDSFGDGPARLDQASCGPSITCEFLVEPFPCFFNCGGSLF